MESFIWLCVEQYLSKTSLHLDVYIQETLDIYTEHPSTKMVRLKYILIKPGNALTSVADVELPDKQKQAFYRSMVARFQFAETWVRFDISYTVGQLARFCASAGSSHFAALQVSREAPELQAGLLQMSNKAHRS